MLKISIIYCILVLFCITGVFGVESSNTSSDSLSVKFQKDSIHRFGIHSFAESNRASTQLSVSVSRGLIIAGAITFGTSSGLYLLYALIFGAIGIVSDSPETTDTVLDGVIIVTGLVPFLGPLAMIASEVYWMDRWGYDGRNAERAGSLVGALFFLTAQSAGLTMLIIGLARNKFGYNLKKGKWDVIAATGYDRMSNNICKLGLSFTF